MRISPSMLAIAGTSALAAGVGAQLFNDKITKARGHGDPVVASYMASGGVALAGFALLMASSTLKPHNAHAASSLVHYAKGAVAGGLLGSTFIGLADVITGH